MSTTTAAHPARSRFVVIDGNMLACVAPHSPLSAQILASRHDAASDWRNGTYPLPMDPEWVRSDACPKPLDLAAVRAGTQAVVLDPARVRPATRADFEEFRLCSVGYRAGTAHYDFPSD